MRFLSKVVQLALISAALLAGLQPAMALDAPKGKVILTISGNVANKNTATGATFDLDMIEKMPQQKFKTLTPWAKEPIEFTGPLLRDVLAAAGAKGTTIKAAALNDYQTAIPLADAQKFDVIVAHKMNGEAIPVKTKGPLFIVYPFDSKPELRSSVYYERSAWQLKSLAIE
jgi:hypothetical protein